MLAVKHLVCVPVIFCASETGQVDEHRNFAISGVRGKKDIEICVKAAQSSRLV